MHVACPGPCAFRIWSKGQVGSSSSSEVLRAKITKTMGLVLGCYVFFWICPMLVFSLGNALGIPERYAHWLGEIAGFGAVINSAINVLIYSAKHKDLRDYLKAALFCKAEPCGSDTERQ